MMHERHAPTCRETSHDPNVHRAIYGEIRGRRQMAISTIRDALTETYAIPTADLEAAANTLGSQHCCACEGCYTLGELGDDRCVRCGRHEAGLAYVVNEVCQPCEREMNEENEMSEEGQSLTVYAITSGSYSDYQVHAVFAQRADADAAAGVKKEFSSYSVEAMAMLAPGADPTRMVTTHYWVQEFRDDGTVGEATVSSETEPWFDRWRGAGHRPHVRFVRAPAHNDKGGRLEVTGTDRAGVAKAATDKRAQLLAHRDQTGKVGPEVNR